MKTILPIFLFLLFLIPANKLFAEDENLQRHGYSFESGLSISSISGSGNDSLKLNFPVGIAQINLGWHLTDYFELRAAFTSEISKEHWIQSIFGGFRAYLIQGKAFHWDAENDVDFFIQSYLGNSWIGKGRGFSFRGGFGFRVPLESPQPQEMQYDYGFYSPSPSVYWYATLDYRYIDFKSPFRKGDLHSALFSSGIGVLF